MSEAIDKAMLREVLNADVNWSAYALGDLAPELIQKCQWIVSGDRDALILIYRGFQTPVLFSMGDTSSLAHLMGKLNRSEAYFLSIRHEALTLIERDFQVTCLDPMIRMVYSEAKVAQVTEPPQSIQALSTTQIALIEQLFRDGEPVGEAPDFFNATMVENGCFFGAFEGPELVAVAGTHLVVPSEKVAAIGCVYTRRSHRGRGLAKLVTSAVLNKLLSLKLETIVLNVKENNLAAIRVYESLGFVAYCRFYEGVASPIRQESAISPVVSPPS